MGKIEFKRVTQEVETVSFDCGVESINEYVKNSYYPTIAQHAYAYSIMYDNRTLGYYMILFREIEIEDFPEDISDIDPCVKDGRISTVHIRYLAIDEKYQGQKIGTNVLRVIIKKVEDLVNDWPIRVITIDARVDLVDWYTEEGFKKMIKNSPGQEGITQAMYFDCMKFSDELMDYTENMYC